MEMINQSVHRCADPQTAAAWIAERIEAGQSVGFVPTMGALHPGHLSLVARARAENDVVVVSIFVNPLQFEDAGDLERYPRDMDSDAGLLQTAGCDMVFSGGLCGAGGFFHEFGQRDQIPTEQPGPGALGLEGALRSGHFEGVATIVRRLFEVVQPTRAYFGQKDFQQTVVIRDLAARMGGPEVVVCPIGREATGLARSSRNERLAPKSRAEARVVFEALVRAHGLWTGGERSQARLHAAVCGVLLDSPGDFDLEYFSLRDPDGWSEVEPPELAQQAVALIAVGAVAADGSVVRLLDNLRLDLPLEAVAAFAAPVAVRAPAKINPELAVLSKRPDGFHEVDLTMLAIDLHDRLLIEWLADGQCRSAAELGDAIDLAVSGVAATDDIPTDASNLVVRAAKLAIESVGWDGSLPGRIRIELQKQIPSQAGLGGGSSDGAAALVGVLKLLARLGFAGGPSAMELSGALGELGSDCAFFLGSTGFARCRGRGEEVEELDGRAFEGEVYVLATPRIACPTGQVFGALGESASVYFEEPWKNELESAALRSIDGLSAFKSSLEAIDTGPWRLAGSGSSFYLRLTGEGADQRGQRLVRACSDQLDLRLAVAARACMACVELVTPESLSGGEQ